MNPGRNQLCPCGSGKKFKLCCLPHLEATERLQSLSEEALLDQWLQEDFKLGQRMLEEYEFSRRFPNGATTGEILELPDGTTMVPLIAKEA